MNKGIIVVLVLLLLAGSVIAGIVITRKSKYTKGTNVPGGAALVANNCQTNCTAPGCSNSECCPPGDTCTVGTQDPPEGSTLNTICDDNHKCTTDQVCIPGDDGQNRCYFAPINKGGPPGKGCICWGRGTCEQSNEGCICDANSNLAGGQQRCQVCKDTYTWDGTKCVATPPPPCKNGGTPTPNAPTPCACPPGFSGLYCDCAGPPPEPTPARLDPPYGHHDTDASCNQMVVCPYGEGTSLTLDKCYHDGQQSDAWTKNGCFYISGNAGWGTHGPDCDFTSTSKTGTETHRISQGYCMAHGATVTAKNDTYGSPGGTCVSPDSGSDGTIGKVCAQTAGMNYSILEGDQFNSYPGQVYIGPKKACPANCC